MLTVGVADMSGLTASTKRVLPSGVTGSKAANGSGLRWNTECNLVMAWGLTLPASIALAVVLYWLFRKLRMVVLTFLSHRTQTSGRLLSGPR
jgi:inorganic phosphate transporter, PiT family